MRGFSLWLFCLLCIPSFAQEFSEWQDQQNIGSKRKIKKAAHQSEMMNQQFLAIHFYEQLYSKKPDKTKYLEKLTQLAKQVKDYDKSTLYAELLCAADSSNENLLNLTSVLMQTERYDEATSLLRRTLNHHLKQNRNKALKRLAENQLRGCYLAGKKDSLVEFPFKLVNIEPLNTAFSEQTPAIYKKELYVLGYKDGTGKMLKPNETLASKQVLKVAKFHNQAWHYTDSMEVILPENPNLFLGNFHRIEDTLGIASVCRKTLQGKTQCDLYWVQIDELRLFDFEKLPLDVNTELFTSTQPFGFVEEERIKVYYTSDRAGGKGGLDVWYFEYRPKSMRYSKPRSLSSKVNTPFNDAYPSYYKGNLYFSSEGKIGFGGYDVYKALGSKTSFAPAEAVFEVNSSYDEIGYRQFGDSTAGVMLSNIPNENQHYGKGCCDDIYQFEIRNPHEIKIPFLVIDATTEEPVPIHDVNYHFSFLDGYYRIPLFEDTSQTGYFLEKVDTTLRPQVKVDKQGYFTAVVNYPDYQHKLNPVEGENDTVIIRIEPIPSGEILLDDIYYEFDSPDLTENAKITIDTTIYEILMNNPTLKVQLNSHTDSKGKLRYNMKLSRARAKSVVDYLIAKGIDRHRLTSKGFGETHPVEPNEHPDGTDNPEGRAKNRRTTFTVLGW